MDTNALTRDAVPVTKTEVWRAADWLCRIGYTAKGVVYGIVGVLTIRYAVFASGEAAGTREALQSLAGETVGFVVLLLIGVGLIGYVLWRLMQAVLDVEHNGADAKGLGKRAAYWLASSAPV